MIAMSNHPEMVVVGGVRYRPEDAPVAAPAATEAPAEKAAKAPANKARTAESKD